MEQSPLALRTIPRHIAVALVSLSSACTAASSGGNPQGGSAGDAVTASTGGATASGGTGATTSSGGATASGGTGATTSSGGATASGGSSSGGATTSGGSSSGGATATGGTGASGGSQGVSQCGTGGAVSEPNGTAPSLVQGQWVNISPPGLYRPGGSKPPYGCMDIHVSPCNHAILYLTTDIEGMWKSLDAGATWKQIGNLPSPVSPGVIEISAQNPLDMYYIGGVRGSSFGFWVSSDGGDHWTEPKGFSDKADNSADGWTPDAYDVKADPSDFKHVLVTFHGPWNWTHAPGVLESTDAGATWTRRMPGADWGTGDGVWFLGDSHTWLFGSQSDGFWRTTNSGQNWTQVSTTNMQHGGVGIYRSASGVLYVGALSHVLRSTDNGLSFTAVAPQTQDGYYAIIGDGTSLYTQWGNGGDNTTGPQPYYTSDETDGTKWVAYDSQTFHDGPYRMTFDPIRRIVYSANWNSGVWALKVK